MRSLYAIVAYLLAVGLVFFSQSYDLWEDTRMPKTAVSQEIWED